MFEALRHPQGQNYSKSRSLASLNIQSPQIMNLNHPKISSQNTIPKYHSKISSQHITPKCNPKIFSQINVPGGDEKDLDGTG